MVPQEIEQNQQPIIENKQNTTNIPEHAKPPRVPIIEAYQENFQQVHPVEKPHLEKFQQVNPVKIQTIKMKPGPTKNPTPQNNPHMIPPDR